MNPGNADPPQRSKLESFARVLWWILIAAALGMFTGLALQRMGF